MEIKDNDMLKDYLKDNLLTRDEAVKITGQSKQVFTNAVANGYIPVFYRGENKFNLYLKEEIVAYTKQKEQRTKNRAKGKDMLRKNEKIMNKDNSKKV